MPRIRPHAGEPASAGGQISKTRAACTMQAMVSNGFPIETKYLRAMQASVFSDMLTLLEDHARDIEGSATARALISAMLHIARSLNLDVVAEGVETPAQQQEPARPRLRGDAGPPAVAAAGRRRARAARRHEFP
jgi:hypothetical protein